MKKISVPKKYSPVPSYLYSDRNVIRRVEGPVGTLQLEGENNRLTLSGTIQKLVLVGDFNRVEGEGTDESMTSVGELVVRGNSNHVSRAVCSSINIEGSYNTVIAQGCRNSKSCGMGNTLQDYSSLPAGPPPAFNLLRYRGSEQLAQPMLSYTSQPYLEMLYPQASTFAYTPAMSTMPRAIFASLVQFPDEPQPQPEEEEERKQPEPEPRPTVERPRSRLREEQKQKHAAEKEEAKEEEEKVSSPAPAQSQPAKKRKKPIKEKNEETKQCPICMERYRKNSRLRALPCGHVFHGKCVGFWLRLHSTCPMCRHKLR